MAKIQPKYSVAQRRAVGSMIVETKRTARQVVELAEAGQLSWEGKQLEPFSMPIGSARFYGRVERQKREAAGARPASKDPAVRMRRLVNQGYAALEADMARLRKMKAGNPARADGIRKVAQAAAELHRLDRAIPSGKDPEREPPEPETPAEEAGPERDIAELVSEARKRGAEHDGPTPKGQPLRVGGSAERNDVNTPTQEAGTPARSERESEDAASGGAGGISARFRVASGDLARAGQ